MEHPEENGFAFRERRSGKDRRAGPTSPFSINSLTGSRRASRRKEDAQKHYIVDLYSPVFLAVLVATLLLSLADAFLTLKLVGEGLNELNPVMDYFLRQGPVIFVVVKYGMTALGLLILLIVKNYCLWRGKVKTALFLFVLPVLYLCLITYEVILFLTL